MVSTVDPRASDRATRVLQVLLVTAIAVSIVHYADNTIRWDEYTQGNDTGLITRPVIPISWVVFTVAGIAGYLLHRRGRWPLAAACLGFYSVSGLISLGHFTEVSPADFDAFQLTFVVLDFVLGAAILAYALWLAVAGGRASNQPAEAGAI